MEESEDAVSVKTSEVCAIVSKATGEVRFTDASGNLILAEDEKGRSFLPIEVQGTIIRLSAFEKFFSGVADT